jgi:hypothetical protein
MSADKMPKKPLREDRVEAARNHDYEPDPEFRAISAGLAHCRICGQPADLHR